MGWGWDNSKTICLTELLLAWLAVLPFDHQREQYFTFTPTGPGSHSGLLHLSGPSSVSPVPKALEVNGGGGGGVGAQMWKVVD